MPEPRTPNLWTTQVIEWLRVLAYPRMREIPAHRRDAALRHARTTELDAIERIGMIAGVLGATLVLESLGVDWESPFIRFLVQFVAALALLAVVVGPFLLRRTRRGLDIECTKHRKSAAHANERTASANVEL
jgi:hypothetical protein